MEPKALSKSWTHLTHLTEHFVFGLSAFFCSVACIPSDAQAQNCVTPALGLVSWWRAEGSAFDYVGGNTGALQGGLGFTTGEVGQAFDFDGTNGYVSVPASPSLDLGAQAGLTLECWIKPADISTHQPLFQWNGGTGPPWGVHFWISVNSGGGTGPGCMFLNVPDTIGDVHSFASPAGLVGTNAWQHVAATYDKASGVARLFHNGLMVASANLGSYTPQSSYPLYLGQRPAGSYYPVQLYRGGMDEVAIYNRALSTNEIQAIYSAGGAGRCFTNAPAILTQPTNQIAILGDTVSFSVAVNGALPLTYQWYFNVTNPVTAGTNASLVLTNLQTNQAGAYLVQVTNAYGPAASSNATLIVIEPNCVSQPAGLVAWLQAQGNSDDSAGGNNGVLQGDLGFTAGKIGQAFNFDGTNGYVSVPGSSNLNVGSQAGLTLECWIKPADISIRQPLFQWNGGTGPPWGVHFWFFEDSAGPGPGSLFINIADTGGDVHHLASPAGLVGANVWQHVAATYDKASGLARLFYNGTVVASANLGTYTPQTSYPLYVGQRPAGSYYPATFYRGGIDELSVYNRALSAAEIQSVYDARSAGKCGIPAVILTQPQSRTVPPGADVALSVVAAGSSPLSYQWRFNETNVMAGATNSSLTLSNAQLDASGFYTVVVSNSFSSVTSTPAKVSVRYVFVFDNGVNLTNSQYSFVESVNIQLQTFFTNGLIFYTLDGSQPNFDSTLYTGTFAVTRSAVLRVLAYSADFFQSFRTDPLTLTIIPTYTLEASTAGGGTVSVVPSGGPYVSNSVVSVIATPASGWTFLGWLGDASGSNRTNSVTMNRNRLVQAQFGTSLNTTASGSGAVTLIPPGGFYPFGTVVELHAVPQVGSYFVLWGNAGSGNSNPMNYTLTNANPTVSSLFSSLGAGQFALAVIPDGLGQVTVNPATNRYASSQNVTLTAVPDAGQQFLNWGGDAAGNDNPLLVSMTQSKTITATFTRRPSLSVPGVLNGMNDQGFRLMLTGEWGGHYRIDGSTNLMDWTEVLTVTNAYGTVQFTDGAATAMPLRFYKAVAVP